MTKFLKSVGKGIKTGWKDTTKFGGKLVDTGIGWGDKLFDVPGKLLDGLGGIGTYLMIGGGVVLLLIVVGGGMYLFKSSPNQSSGYTPIPNRTIYD